MKIQKTVSLDEVTAKIAEDIPNFSEWVRAKLLELDETAKTAVKYYARCRINSEHIWGSYSQERLPKDGSCPECFQRSKMDIRIQKMYRDRGVDFWDAIEFFNELVEFE